MTMIGCSHPGSHRAAGRGRRRGAGRGDAAGGGRLAAGPGRRRARSTPRTPTRSPSRERAGRSTSTALGADSEAAGNPVVPLVTRLRAGRSTTPLAGLVHRGLTSQDVLDTALVLLARDALARVRADLTASADGAGRARRPAPRHRDGRPDADPVRRPDHLRAQGGPVAGRRAGRPRRGRRRALAALPVQCGGAAGTLSLRRRPGRRPRARRRSRFADELGLRWPGLPVAHPPQRR